ncbi:50S ribosomal protein L9 [Chloroflexota bacterium]
MKVVFLENVAGVGMTGDVKEVSSGYARNFLIPRNKAVLASNAAIKEVESKRKIDIRNQELLAEEMAKIAAKLESTEVTLKARSGGNDKLYGSITNADIAEELENTLKLVVDKKKIELEKPINQLGNYEVPVRLGPDVMSQIKVTVVEEETD